MKLTEKQRKMLACAIMPAGAERDHLESTIVFTSPDAQEQAYADLLDALITPDKR